MECNTLPRLLKHNCELYGKRKIALRRKELGVWKVYTWEDSYQNVKYLSLGLLFLGVQAGDRLAIIGDNDPEWDWMELATQAIGGIPVGIFTDCVLTEVKYIMEHSGASFAAARDQEQVDKLMALENELPKLKRIIYWDSKGMWGYDDPMLITYGEVQHLGREYDKEHPGVFEQSIDDTSADNVAVLCYTSGTGGMPKGAPLTHSALLAFTRCHFTYYSPTEITEYLSSTPPAWAPEQWYGMVLPLVSTMVKNYPEGPATVQVDMREIAPHFLAGPPRIWEGTASRIQALIIDTYSIIRFIYNLLIPVGYKLADLHIEGKNPNLFWKIIYQVGNWLVFRPLKDKIGLIGIKAAISSGGIISPATFRFLCGLGIEIRQLYGLTETAIVALHTKEDIKFESVGPVAPQVELRLADDNEIMVRSDQVIKGYYQNPEANKDKFVMGWFSTGDAGYITDDGHLNILDRVSDMMELPSGGKFSPSYVEAKLRFSPYVMDATLIGGGNHPYVTAIISTDFANVSRWAEIRKVNYTTYTDLSQKEEVYGLIRQELDKVNKSIPEQARIKRFVNLHKELDPDEAELTRTRKIRRSFMQERYGNMIDALYGEAISIPVETPVTYRDGKTGVVRTVVKVNHLD